MEGQGLFYNSELIQTVYSRLPIPKRMLMCVVSSNRWEFAIVVGVGEGSICRKTARSLITRSWCTYVYSVRILRGKKMDFVMCVHIYIYILYKPYTVLVWFIYLQKWLVCRGCTEDHGKRSRSPAVNGYQGHPIRNVGTGGIIDFQHRVAVCTQTL